MLMRMMMDDTTNGDDVTHTGQGCQAQPKAVRFNEIWQLGVQRLHSGGC